MEESEWRVPGGTGVELLKKDCIAVLKIVARSPGLFLPFLVSKVNGEAVTKECFCPLQSDDGCYAYLRQEKRVKQYRECSDLMAHLQSKGPLPGFSDYIAERSGNMEHSENRRYHHVVGLVILKMMVE